MSSAQTRAMKLQQVLERLASATPDVTGAAVVSDDGLIIGSALSADTDEDSVGGMASVLLSLGARVAGELDLGDVEQFMIRGTQNNALMMQSGDGALLMVLMTRRAKLGLIFLDAKRAAKDIADII